MAIIGNIRKRSGLLIGIVGVSLLAFLLSDALSNRYGSGKRDNTIGKINGKKIDYAEFAKKIDARPEFKSASEDVMQRFRDAIWNSFVDDNVIKEEYKKLGLGVTADELTWLEFGQPEPPQEIVSALSPQGQVSKDFADTLTGMLDMKKVFAFRQSLTEENPQLPTWVEMIDEAVSNRATMNKYNKYVAKCVYVNSLEAKNAYLAEKATVTGKVTGQNFNSINDSSVTVTEEDMITYLKKNGKKFEQKEEKRSFEFAAFKVKATREDSLDAKNWIEEKTQAFRTTTNDSLFVYAATEKNIDTVFKSRGTLEDMKEYEDSFFRAEKGAVFGPVFDGSTYKSGKLIDVKTDSVKWIRSSQIMLNVEGSTKEDTAKAKAEAAKLLAELKSGKSFDSLVLLRSKDQSSLPNKGDVGYINKDLTGTRSYVSKQYWNALEKLGLNQYAIVADEMGVHIIKATSVPETKLVKVAFISKTVEMSSATISAEEGKAREYASKAIAGEAFDKVAEKYKMPVLDAKNIKANDTELPGVGVARKVIQWIYADEREVGDISSPIDIAGGTIFIVGKVTGISKKGIPELQYVRKEVENEVRKQKKAEKLTAQLNDAISKANGNITMVATGLKTVAYDVSNQAFDNSTLPFIGNDPYLVGTMFGMPKGKLSPPIVTENGVYVVIITETTPAPPLTDFKPYADRVYGERSGALTQKVSEALKKAAKIEDYRYRFF